MVGTAIGCPTSHCPSHARIPTQHRRFRRMALHAAAQAALLLAFRQGAQNTLLHVDACRCSLYGRPIGRQEQQQGKHMTMAEIKARIAALVARGCIFYVSHSGGKDSQALYAVMTQLVPADQIVVVHADLGIVEWQGVQDHIKATITHTLNVVRSVKTLLQMVARRHATRPEVPSWPSSAHRQCTSDLKRNPIYKFIRNDMKARGVTLAANVTGIRAEESTGRAKQAVWQINKTLSVAGREVHEIKPIHGYKTAQVFLEIKLAGQQPFWAYAAGNSRLSCVFCIMGSKNDLQNGARHNPELARKYIELEKRTGYTMFHGQSLAEKLEN